MVYAALKKLFSTHNYQSLNIFRISKSQLINNYNQAGLINKKIKIAPVLKSNAYGHGLEIVGRVIDLLNPPFICVDSIFEAYKLLKVKIKSKILIMGYVNPENLRFKKLPFSYVVYGIDQLMQILKYQPNAGIHIFVDTGMHREGIFLNELDSVLKKIPLNYIGNIEGVMSHLAFSEEPNNKDTINQVNNFKKVLQIFENNNIKTKWKHIANSYGLINSKIIGIDNISNLARVGYSLYENVGKLYSHIIQIKQLKKGDKVGYCFTYTANKDMKVAVLPIGYNDGVDRGFSNKGQVFIKERKCPIVGRVSMNMTTVDITSVNNPRVGDEVEIDLKVSLPETILYELMVKVNPEIKRVLID